MPVYQVTATYKPNGNSRSRPFVADNHEDALLTACAEWDINESDISFEWKVVERPDQDGSYERSLLEMERRRVAMESYSR